MRRAPARASRRLPSRNQSWSRVSLPAIRSRSSADRRPSAIRVISPGTNRSTGRFSVAVRMRRPVGRRQHQPNAAAQHDRAEDRDARQHRRAHDAPLEAAAPRPVERRREPGNQERDAPDADERRHLHQRQDIRTACTRSNPTWRAAKNAIAGTRRRPTPSEKSASIREAAMPGRGEPIDGERQRERRGVEGDDREVGRAGHRQRCRDCRSPGPRRARATRTADPGLGGIDRDA